MSFLEQLTRDERDLIVSLPYRVGWWMSQCDDSGGDESDEQEAAVLASIIEGYAREVFGSEMAQYVMIDTMMNKERWPEWAEMEFFHIPADCEKALEILSRHGEEKDVTAFANQMVEIAEAVAMAFSEYQFTSIIDKIKMYYTYYVESAKAKKKGERYKSLHEFLSISGAERRVLLKLADALSVEYS